MLKLHLVIILIPILKKKLSIKDELEGVEKQLKK